MFDIHGFEMTVFKLLIGITLIVLHLRLTGKQRTVQLTPIDFIGNFILGGVIGGVIYNHAISLRSTSASCSSPLESSPA